MARLYVDGRRWRSRKKLSPFYLLSHQSAVSELGRREGVMAPSEANHDEKAIKASRELLHEPSPGETHRAPLPAKNVLRPIIRYWRSASRGRGSVSLLGRLAQPTETYARAVRR